jgi:hypothetical protein
MDAALAALTAIVARFSPKVETVDLRTARALILELEPRAMHQ